MTSDAGDLAAARSGGPDAHAAFARMYDRHSPVVRALCRRHSPSEAEADDALQETFLRAFQRMDRVSSADGLRSWLYQIASHVCSERRRAGSRRKIHEQRAIDERGARMNTGSLHSRTDAPDAAERAEQLAQLSAALDQLPDDERLAIHLYYLEADPVGAAGVAIGISRSGFYKLLDRAREHVASIMKGAHA